MPTSQDERFLKLALREARKGLGLTSPNPAVGAVIVKNGRVLATGYHRARGCDHAEVAALKKLKESAKAAAMYVTLEPCNHFGLTPPCTEAIISAGIERVVFGFCDPNPCVTGGGAGRLKNAGIKVESGILADVFERFYRPYKKYSTSGNPYLKLKLAATLDGRLGASTGDSKWISNEESRLLVQKARAESDAILTGVGTVLFDDPRMNVRIKTAPKKNPKRIILDSTLKITEELFIVKTAREYPTIVATTERADKQKVKRLEQAGIAVEIIAEKEGRISLPELLRRLGALGIMNILVETGPTLAGELVRGGFIDEFWLILCPKLTMGGDGLPLFNGEGVKLIRDALPLHIFESKSVAGDIHIHAYPQKTASPHIAGNYCQNRF
ncbi:MAG: bifunctional diaminohydroxyphosphoribosylaminopyrimidine deaminase/5-amino-6-(5-phosphoribosylamino)uracil reductase RibD [Myxococcota bacterium]